MNFCLLEGRLGREPQAFANGKIAKVSLAVTTRSKNASTGKYDSKVNWIKVTAFNKTAEWLMQCAKGENIVVTGSLRENTFETQGGRQVSEVVVVAFEIRRNGGIPWPEKYEGDAKIGRSVDDMIKTEVPWGKPATPEVEQVEPDPGDDDVPF